MVVLAVGDICSNNGLAFFETKLPALKNLYGVDFVVANGENSAPGGTGVTKDSIDRIFSAGADVITTGNHAFHAQGYENLFENTRGLIRPLNFSRGTPGSGFYLFDLGYCTIAVVNLIGRAFMQINADNYYSAMDDFLKTIETPNIIVDFHAETTSEKIAFARYYDGKASFIFGTHTHVATADETVFPNETAYITDLGMTGPIESVIGVEIDAAVKRQRDSVPVRFTQAKGPSMLSGAIAEIDHKTGRAVSIERISILD
jgi:metallophosphoesterase (TIGR00282 family)